MDKGQAYNIQMLNFLSEKIKMAVANHNLQSLYEIRIRVNQPVSVLYGGRYFFLSEYGITSHPEKAIRCTSEEIADFVFRAGNYSVYAIEEQIKQGFITTDNGERIGLAGEYVFDKGQPLALRNFSAICIRVPHKVLGCGQTFYDKCMSDRIQNVLLMSSPGLGKTTILRDVVRILSNRTKKNILVCDERGEIAIGDIGDTVDVMKYSDKKTAFEAGIRAMRPDIIVTDEISLEDCVAVRRAISAGINVLASAHFSNIAYVKEPFIPLFDKYVLLKEDKIGEIACIYDNEKKECFS